MTRWELITSDEYIAASIECIIWYRRTLKEMRADSTEFMIQLRDELLAKEKVFTQDEVYEILRQVMFTGTPELYDQGGLHGNYNLKPDHTLRRAKEAFKKYYLKQQDGTV